MLRLSLEGILRTGSCISQSFNYPYVTLLNPTLQLRPSSWISRGNTIKGPQSLQQSIEQQPTLSTSQTLHRHSAMLSIANNLMDPSSTSTQRELRSVRLRPRGVWLLLPPHASYNCLLRAISCPGDQKARVLKQGEQRRQERDNSGYRKLGDSVKPDGAARRGHAVTFQKRIGL